MSDSQIVRTLMCESENDTEFYAALNELCPVGAGGVGHAMRKRRDWLLAIAKDIVRSERSHASFYGSARC